MRGVMGVLWTLGGAIAGLVVGMLVGMAIVKFGNVTSREGAAGYAVIAVAIICAMLGALIGIMLYARSAPSGQGATFAGSAVLGVVALVAAIAFGIWGFMNLREAPIEYAGAQANLELELRVRSSDAPEGTPSSWLDIEVQTAKTRPVGTVLTSSVRTEGEYLIIPVVQGPLYRSGQRVIVVRVGERQVEAFIPKMKRTPDPKADWSEWERPRAVDPPYGVTPPTPLKSMIELRYRVRPYGE
jgi:hypothetical protein